MLTWEAKKEAIFEMPVGVRCDATRATRKIYARARLSVRATGRSTVGSRSARDTDACFFDTDD